MALTSACLLSSPLRRTHARPSAHACAWRCPDDWAPVSAVFPSVMCPVQSAPTAKESRDPGWWWSEGFIQSSLCLHRKCAELHTLSHLIPLAGNAFEVLCLSLKLLSHLALNKAELLSI